MTWTDATSASTPSWTGSGATTTMWASRSESFASGNFSRFIDADPLQDAEGGVDFGNTFSTENPWVFTTRGSIDFTGTARNDPI